MTCSSGHPRPVSPTPAMPSSVVNRMMNLGTSQNPASPGSFGSYSDEFTVSGFIGTRTRHLSIVVIFMSLTPRLARRTGLAAGDAHRSPTRTPLSRADVDLWPDRAGGAHVHQVLT